MKLGLLSNTIENNPINFIMFKRGWDNYTNQLLLIKLSQLKRGYNNKPNLTNILCLNKTLLNGERDVKLLM